VIEQDLLEAGRHLESSLDQEHADATDAADEDMPGSGCAVTRSGVSRQGDRGGQAHLGKKPISAPSLKRPRSMNTIPVRTALKAKLTMTVGMMTCGWGRGRVGRVQFHVFTHFEFETRTLSSPTSAVIRLTRMWKKGTASIIMEPLPPLLEDERQI